MTEIPSSSGRGHPFYAGSILGLRSWRVQVRLPSSASRLRAASADASWEPGGAWTEAKCRPLGGRARRHRSPKNGCSCGLYALHPSRSDAAALWGDPSRLTLEGLWGVVEAAGRIEVHGTGFRAERARPIALVAASTCPPETRAAVEELAALYGTEVLSPDRFSDVIEWCERRGGVLDRPQLDELLGAVEPSPEVSASPAPAPAPSPTPAAPEPPWLKRAISKLGDGLLMLVLGVLMVAWYGMWAVFGVVVVGNLLFGWFETETETEPAPAEVVAVRVDRERCEVTATLDSSRRFEDINFTVDGHLRNGDPLSRENFKVGPVEKGRSKLVVARPKPALCRSRHHFTVRVKPRWGEVAGRAVEGRSRFEGSARGDESRALGP